MEDKESYTSGEVIEMVMSAYNFGRFSRMMDKKKNPSEEDKSELIKMAKMMEITIPQNIRNLSPDLRGLLDEYK